MISGVVPFEEVIEGVKDLTGIENTKPLQDKFRRWIMNAEREIGAGGLIIRKKRQFSIGDGNYTGKQILMPEDFIGEYSYGALSAGVLNGSVLTLHCDGPEEIDLYYMGLLTDDAGNPYTTRHHLPAVEMYCVWRLYSSRYFLGKGNLNQYKEYKMEWENACMAARGEDAWPTEQQWSGIGKILNGGAFVAWTDCGMMNICGDNTFTYGSDTGEDLNVTYMCELVDLFDAAMQDQSDTDSQQPLFMGATIATTSVVAGTLIGTAEF